MCAAEKESSIWWGSVLAKDAPEDQADARRQGSEDQENVGEAHIPKADVHSQDQGEDQPGYERADEDLAPGGGTDHGEDNGQDQQDDQDGSGVDMAKREKAEAGHVGVFEEHKQTYQDQDHAEYVLKSLFP